MKRRLLIGLLAFGTVAGFGSGFFALGARAHARHSAFERHVADVCADSAIRARGGGASPTPTPTFEP